MKYWKIYLLLMVGVAILHACSKIKLAAPKSDEIRFEVPKNFPEPIYQFEDNALSSKGFLLGKKLFYDARLSGDKSVSCGSCHQQFAAFAQLDHAVSHGVNNCLGKRNAPVLFNLAWQKEFFWDGGAKNLEIVPLNAISDACEMGSDINKVLAFLNGTPPYPQLFKEAFGATNVNSRDFLKALAQFTATMVSANSKYDYVMRNPAQYAFSADEKLGYQVFSAKCAGCHTEPLFTNLAYSNNGLAPSAFDEGRKIITGLAADLQKFRIPTLRNVELSAPYMHDGRFNTLEKVLEHYNSGVHQNANLDPKLNNGKILGIPLGALEKQQIITFLKTLTDEQFINNKIFSEN